MLQTTKTLEPGYATWALQIISKVEDRKEVLRFGLGSQVIPQQTLVEEQLLDAGFTVNVIAGLVLCMVIGLPTMQRKLYL